MIKESDQIELLNLINEVFFRYDDKNIYFKRGKSGIFSGLSGVSLYQFYYSKYFSDEALSNEAIKNIIDCFKIIKNPCFSTYCDGLAGLGWTMDHLAEYGFIEDENDDLLRLIDDHLFEMMKKDINQGYYDFLHGAIGYGYYFVNRYKRTLEIKLKKKYESILKYLLDAINKSANKGSNGIYWTYPVSQKSKDRWINLSLSHGMSNMIIFLVKLGEMEILDNQLINELVRGAVEYIINCKNQTKDVNSLYPSAISNESVRNTSSRLAWCYGDIGIGIAFLRAGNFLGNSTYIENSMEIFINCSTRRTHLITSVVDPMICHGSFGLSQIFQQLYSENEIPELRHAAGFWFEDGFKYFKENDFFLTAEKISKLNGYKWQSNSSLLTGLSGVGLTIISNITSDKSWNNSLLIS